MAFPIPAHRTKHLRSIEYPFEGSYFHLLQLDNGHSNGTALWLGGQCLAFFLVNQLRSRSVGEGKRPRVMDLGSGIGLTALALCSIGWDVLATDIPDVISTVLSQNIAQNTPGLPATSGRVEVRELDWTVTPDKWTWDNDRVIASASTSGTLSSNSKKLLRPPFDLIISSDTIYAPDLTRPFLRTLHALSLSASSRSPPIYLCIERRDPSLVDDALTEARSLWGFNVERVSPRKLVKAMEKSGVRWAREEWEGIEIWKLILARA